MKLDDIALPARKRAYNQGARARAAEATAHRIMDAFEHRIRDDWFDQITLDQVARDAGVTVPTVVRRFGSKEGVLEAVRQRLAADIQERRSIATGDITGALSALMEDYEAAGDLTIRVLAQEERHAPFRAMSDQGRAHHRTWIADIFSPWLDPLDPATREARLDALVAATDVYVWKLARRDMGRSRGDTLALMLRLVDGVIATPSAAPAAAPAPTWEDARRD